MPRPATRNGVTQVAGGWRWRVMIDGQRHTGIERTEAAAIAARETRKVRHGGQPDTNPTVAVWLEGHIGTAKRSETTVENWRWAYEALPEAFTARRLSEVTPPIVAHLWHELADEPPHRLVKLSNLCSQAWQQAVTYGMVPVNPWRVARVPQPPAADEIEPPDPTAVHALIRAADPWFAVWLKVAAYTGARGGEVCALQWGDVDWERGSITIRRSLTRSGTVTAGKTGRRGHRVVDLDDDTLDALRTHSTHVLRVKGARESDSRRPTPWRNAVIVQQQDRRPRADEWVFAYPDGLPMRPDGAAQRMAFIGKQIGIDVSPHDLRHFAVTQWLALGMSIPDVAAMIGDNPKTVMQTYAHHIPHRRRDMVAALSRLVRES